METSVTSQYLALMISVAPMMDWTDRHCRYFMRLLSPSASLYTEMITANALHYGDTDSLLRFDSSEHPLAIQLGGSDPVLMAEAASKAAQAGYDEVNINVGCPSDRVQNGRFGACLMAHPDIVAACVREMMAAVDVPVTVKTRIGIDDKDSDEFLGRFIGIVAEAGCRKFIVHARIAVLEGLSPKENRSIPPLNYERVYRLKEAHPDLEIVLNGGITEIQQVDAAIEKVDGAMIGRQAYHHPYFLAELEHHMHPQCALPDRIEVIEKMIPYIEGELQQGERLGRITRHMTGLFAGLPGARAWRRYLSEHAYRENASTDVLREALDAMPVAA
ncbi:MAG: tRNA dihydrouridine(20/20a) synthase DusA [Woeseiaceae bacterium]|nr:tRNA dihydrouridine(20/20a) synthase DusA [Woeseiaceae bacterium]NIP19746.1 tRNA dihydrouridine(20/20a) synthase DusA [Woeseiaceae bacterium]NIS89863.1 tRNA dihydrouridine(20/20a) synthase DusA [Woeseiaceae bacterium]